MLDIKLKYQMTEIFILSNHVHESYLKCV